jgi:hypothetical protein
MSSRSCVPAKRRRKTLEANGADGISDVEGKATRVGARMEPGGASDIDGQTERSIWAGAHESKRAQRASFNGTDGFNDIEHVRSGIARVDGNAAR